MIGTGFRIGKPIFRRPSSASLIAGNSAEAQQFYDRLLTPPSSEREAIYNELIDGLVVDGVWSKLDALYLFCAADEGTAITNLVQNSYNASRWQSAGAVTFTIDQGFSNGAPLRLLSSNFNPTTASSPHFTRNNAMVGLWSYLSTQINNYDINMMLSLGSTLGGIEAYLKWSNGVTYCSVNDSSNLGPVNSGDSSGMFLFQRESSNSRSAYRNNILLGSDTTASSALVNGKIVFTCLHNTRAAFIGASLSSGERTSLYNRLTTYITSVTGGVP